VVDNTTLFLAGSIIILVWGIAHIVPTKSVVASFRRATEDNRRIIKMEWIAEGLTLCFIGVLTLLLTNLIGFPNPASIIVYRACAGMLITMAVLTGLTGARTSIVPIKICPYIKTTVAILFLVGSAV